MITKGKIIKTPSKYYTNKDGQTMFDNKFVVDLPIFNSSGINKDNSMSASQVNATLCYQPGNLDSYRVGDVVYVTFEDNDYSRAVIIGKLYLGDDDCVGMSSVDKLKVKSGAILPENTTLGDIKVSDISRTIKNLSNISSKVLDNEDAQEV